MPCCIATFFALHNEIIAGDPWVFRYAVLQNPVGTRTGFAKSLA
jgi:hypothetical protein